MEKLFPYLDVLLKLIIFALMVILFLNFLNNYLDVDWLSKSPGRKLNNPLAGLLVAIFLLGWLNPEIRKTGFNYLKILTTRSPYNYFFFGSLILAQIFLEGMYLTSPSDSFWNLDYEKGYGTYFSTIQLYILGLTVLAIAHEEKAVLSPRMKSYEWKLVAFLFMALALDECIGIHDNYRAQVKIVSFLFSEKLAESLPHWLWIYSPIILVTVIFLMRFFIRASENKPRVRVAFLMGLSCWCAVLVLEKMGQSPSPAFPPYFFIALEEGAEMFGATLLLLGFSIYLKRYNLARLRTF